ncbi:MAG: FkbM family methyltransferase [Rhizobiales bacterium]|nr:FkbM family methyltransferase [Hyphomicrobiales bacterium]
MNMVLDRNDIPIYYAEDAYIHHYVSPDRMTKAYFRNRAHWSGVTHAYVHRLFFGYEEAFKRTKLQWSELWLKLRVVMRNRGKPENFSRLCQIACLVTWLIKFYQDYLLYKLSGRSYTPPQVTWTTQNWLDEISRWPDGQEKYEQLYQLYLTAGEIEGARQALAKLETYPPADPSKSATASWKEWSAPPPWRLRYEQLVRQLRDVVEATVPRQGAVLVVSKGDGKLLKLNGRRAWHFPQDDHGKYTGYYPADSAAAIAQLETLRGKGADFIVFPSTACWWLEHYGEFRQHLLRHYQMMSHQKEICLIFDLRAPGGRQLDRVGEASSTSIEDQFTGQRMLPPQVALTAEYWIKEISGWPEGVTKYVQLHHLFLTVGDTARAEEALRQAAERLPPVRTVDTLTGTEIHSIKGLEKLGSAYGGWIVPTLDISAGAVCYLAGVGEDITFDLALIERFNCSVFAFDPTPRAKLHVHKQAAQRSQFHFFEFGLWDAEEILKFYAPANSEHVSHSVLNLQNSDRYFEAPCKRLSAIMREMGHSRIQLLKLDIEGAEYRVIDSLVEDRLDIGIICVEYHAVHNDADDEFPGKIKKYVARLCEIGYALVAVEPHLNYTFVKRSFLAP